MKRLLEAVDKAEFAGEKVGQKPGDQWRGDDKKTPGKKLVGEENVFKELESHLKENAIERKLKAQLAEFKQGVTEGTLNEYRDQLWAWIQSKFPSTQWPEYVQRDFLYAKAKGLQSQKDLEDFLDEIQRDFGRVRWRLEKLPITLDVFTAKTQGMIKQREGGRNNPYQVPKDAERHALQQRMIQQKGVSAEPIIVAKLSNGYDLIEGWHRTIQHLKAYPEGYTAPAWVGYGATYTSELKPGLAEGIDPDTFEELDARIIARAAKQIVPTIRAKNTPEGYVHVTTEDGLDLYIGAGVADGVISVYIGSGGGVTTSGARKGAVTEIIRSVYHAAVRKYGEPDTPGELTIDHDAGHGVWQHIADKLGLTYAAVKVKESSVTERKKTKRKSRWAAYGPGPYGGYGFVGGYSGAGGVSGGDGGGVGEASYEGNIGMMEVSKFFKIATTAQKKLFKELLEKGKRGLAWKLIQDVTDTKLQGREFEVDES